MKNQTDLMEEALSQIGPTCLKHPDGRHGVLWHSGRSPDQYAVFPRDDHFLPTMAVQREADPSFCFRSIDAIVEAGWLID